jgi:hypothetical protein
MEVVEKGLDIQAEVHEKTELPVHEGKKSHLCTKLPIFLT